MEINTAPGQNSMVPNSGALPVGWAHRSHLSLNSCPQGLHWLLANNPHTPPSTASNRQDSCRVFTSICYPLQPGSLGLGQGLIGCQGGLLQVCDREDPEQVLQGMDGSS